MDSMEFFSISYLIHYSLSILEKSERNNRQCRPTIVCIVPEWVDYSSHVVCITVLLLK